MADSFSDFTPALPAEIKWNVGENQYPDAPPKRLGLFIPIETIAPLARYLSAIAQDPDRVKSSKIWNAEKRTQEQVDGVWLSGSGRVGDYGDFGSINPAALEEDSSDKPF